METVMYKQKLIAGPLADKEVNSWKGIASKAHTLYYGEGDVSVALTAGRVIYVSGRYYVEFGLPTLPDLPAFAKAVPKMNLGFINNGTKDILVENNTMYYLLAGNSNTFALKDAKQHYRCMEYAENIAAYHVPPSE